MLFSKLVLSQENNFPSRLKMLSIAAKFLQLKNRKKFPIMPGQGTMSKFHGKEHREHSHQQPRLGVERITKPEDTAFPP